MKKILALICARKNSSEIPNKNLIKFRGKTLVEHAIFQAMKLKNQYNLKVVCSTDSLTIARLAKKNGASVPFIRPKKLALNNSPEWLVWKHALKFLKEKENYTPDIFVSLSPTAPLRKNKDILKCINLYLKNKKDIFITAHKSKNNPYFNMVEKTKSGNFKLIKNSGNYIFNRQKSPKVFSMNTIAYVCSPKYIEKKRNIFDGKVGVCETKREDSLDLDTKEDLINLKKLYSKK